MDILIAIDKLDDTIHNAKPFPMTDQVRLNPEKLRREVEDVHSTLPHEARKRAEADGLLERLDVLIRDAKPVPFTQQIRIDKDQLYEVLDGLRHAIADTRH